MYDSSTSTICYQKNSPKIVDTIKIHGKYFDASMVKEKALLLGMISALTGALITLGALNIF